MKIWMDRLMKPAILCVGLVLSAPILAFEVSNPDQAKQIAKNFVSSMKLGYDVDKAQCTEFQQHPDSPQLWRVVGPNGEFTLGINRTNGAIVALTDVKVMDEIINVDDFRNPYVLKTDDDVWNVADKFLLSSSLNNRGFKRKGIEWVCREDNAMLYPSNKGTRVVARYEQRDSKYEGAINTATLTLDAITGKIEVATASTIWKFQPPASTVSKSEALAKLKSLFAGESNQELYEWPGDSLVEGALKLQIMRGGNKCFTTDYGEQLNKNFTARVCWTYENSSLGVALDAENLNPVWASSKSNGKKYLKELPKGSVKIEEGIYALPDQNMAMKSEDGRWEYINSLKPIGNVSPPINPVALFGIGSLAVVFIGVVLVYVKKGSKASVL